MVELLLVLVEKRGQLVTKEDLINAVWPDTFVEESNLTTNISILRKHLGSHPESGEYIETIPKRGYRFIAPVTQVTDRVLDAPGATSATSERRHTLRPKVLVGVIVGLFVALLARYWGESRQARIEALAVLPLANVSGDPAQEYFADGMTDALAADLAQIGALRVSSRNSIIQFKGTRLPLPEIARRLKVDAVVSGSVLRSGQRVRIIAELIHASTDRRLWTKTYERNVADILDLQNDVVRAIANEVRTKVTPPTPAPLAHSHKVNSHAYEAYLKGRYYWNIFTLQSLEKSIEYFEQAIELDSEYAQAHAGLADAYLGLQTLGAVAPEEIHSKVVAAVTKALQIDDSLGEAHAVMAVAKAHEWDWAAAERECRKAIVLSPASPRAHWSYSNQLRHRGLKEESITEARRALELDPLSPWANESLAEAYSSARQYDLAIEQYEKTLELYPNQSSSRNALGWAYVYKKIYDKGLIEIQKSYGEDPDLSPELAYVYAVSGNKGKAQKILARLLAESKRNPIEPHHFALIYAGLGQKNEAMVMLEQAYRQHSPMMVWLKVDPRFDSLRPDPAFQELMRRVGLL